MPGSRAHYPGRSFWLLLPLILLFISLFYVRALVSVSIGLMGITALYLTWQNKKFTTQLSTGAKWSFYLLLGLFALVLLDGFRLGPTSFWFQELMMKLPLVILPWYLLSVGLTLDKVEDYLVLLNLSILITAISSVANYWMNIEAINALLLQSKHVPIIGGSHHIYFGVFMTLAFWMSAYYSYFGRHRKFWILSIVLLLLCIHVLVSRTGLIALYLSVACFLLWLVWYRRSDRRVLWLLLFALALPFVAFQFSGSLRNKVSNSLEDLRAVRSGEDNNYKSLAMRMEAWHTTLDLFKDKPLTGTGAELFDRELQVRYELNKTKMNMENRIGPHNQFLETSAKYGVMSFLLLLTLFATSIWHFRDSIFFLLIAVIFLFVFQVESLLERQLGMIAFGLFFFLSFTAKSFSKASNRTE